VNLLGKSAAVNLRIPKSWKEKLDLINSKRRVLKRPDGKFFSCQDLIREAIDEKFQLSARGKKEDM
jgi:hypothetical protein